jgi:hypothetical protein
MFGNLNKYKPRILIATMFLGLGLFQNCTQDVAVRGQGIAIAESGNGSGYGGMQSKYVSLLTVGLCADGSNISAEIDVYANDYALLTRTNCSNVTPTPIPAKALGLMATDQAGFTYNGLVFMQAPITSNQPSAGTPAVLCSGGSSASEAGQTVNANVTVTTPDGVNYYAQVIEAAYSGGNQVNAVDSGIIPLAPAFVSSSSILYQSSGNADFLLTVDTVKMTGDLVYGGGLGTVARMSCYK